GYFRLLILSLKNFICNIYTIFHMRKIDISKAISEIKRVLKPGGICFVNFLSINDKNCGDGEKIGEGEFLQEEDGQKVIHAYYDINEAEVHFKGMNILMKENRILERIFEGEKIKQGYIDYIVQKSE
ncbi:methyltransferase domain-containing protein, partial [Clostridium saccharoperbutylacetonicum]|uniref:methyltransferase domain-containing protein n=1 Tax=Clostridium saccharoperbutylacetonicum TaxID=36745 RepID=UPI0039E87E19